MKIKTNSRDNKQHEAETTNNMKPRPSAPSHRRSPPRIAAQLGEPVPPPPLFSDDLDATSFVVRSLGRAPAPPTSASPGGDGGPLLVRLRPGRPPPSTG